MKAGARCIPVQIRSHGPPRGPAAVLDSNGISPDSSDSRCRMPIFVRRRLVACIFLHGCSCRPRNSHPLNFLRAGARNRHDADQRVCCLVARVACHDIPSRIPAPRRRRRERGYQNASLNEAAHLPRIRRRAPIGHMQYSTNTFTHWYDVNARFFGLGFANPTNPICWCTQLPQLASRHLTFHPWGAPSRLSAFLHSCSPRHNKIS